MLVKTFVTTELQRQARAKITQIGGGRDRIGGDIEGGRATEAGAEGIGMGCGGGVGTHQGDGISRRQLRGIQYGTPQFIPVNLANS